MKPYGLKLRDLGYYKRPNIHVSGYCVSKSEHETRRCRKRTARRESKKECLKYTHYVDLVKCDMCSDTAVWVYMPSDSEAYRCEFHVPRGCSCTDDPNEPCCEWNYYEVGYEK